MAELQPQILNLVGVCTNPSLRRYVLWTLKLMKDVPAIFNGKIVFIDLTKQKDQLLSKL